MKDLLKGLLALAIVAVGGMIVYFVGVILFAIIGELVGLAVALVSFLLRLAAIAFFVFLALRILGKFASCVRRTS